MVISVCNYSKLENGDIIESEKNYMRKRPKTSYKITEFGIEQFEAYVNLLEKILNGTFINNTE